jgi:hypothetical protein
VGRTSGQRWLLIERVSDDLRREWFADLAGGNAGLVGGRVVEESQVTEGSTMSRGTITTDRHDYEIGWNEFGWFASREDGESSDYFPKKRELRAAIAAWERVEAAGPDDFDDGDEVEPDTSDFEWIAEGGDDMEPLEDDDSDLEHVAGDSELDDSDLDIEPEDEDAIHELLAIGYCDLGGEGGGA